MAILKNKKQVIFKLWPYRFIEKSIDPKDFSWILTYISIESNSKTYLDDTFSITDSDLESLTEGLRKITEGSQNNLTVTTMDANCTIKIYCSEREFGNFIIEIWYGEPSEALTKGCKLEVVIDELHDFLRQLTKDKINIKSESKLS